MSYHVRKILPPGGSRKRKEREPPPYYVKPSGGLATTSSKAAELVPSNKLLAGYMAYEFLTKGTLLGQKFDPARAEAVPLSSSFSAEWRKAKLDVEAEPSNGTRGKPAAQQTSQSYADVAHLLKSDGAHITGIVNPTQLARWIQM